MNLTELKKMPVPELNELVPGTTVEHGPFLVEVIQVTHSIPDGVAFAFRTPHGIVMHTGDFTLDDVLDHYNFVSDAGNTNLDPRLKPQGIDMTLHLTTEEREAVKAFLHALAGTAIYTDPKWSDPFPR